MVNNADNATATGRGTMASNKRMTLHGADVLGHRASATFERTGKVWKTDANLPTCDRNHVPVFFSLQRAEDAPEKWDAIDADTGLVLLGNCNGYDVTL